MHWYHYPINQSRIMRLNELAMLADRSFYSSIIYNTLGRVRPVPLPTLIATPSSIVHATQPCRNMVLCTSSYWHCSLWESSCGVDRREITILTLRGLRGTL